MNAAPASRMPYPGLRSFRREESDLFFGREDCITTMVDRLAANHFLAVLGSSGTGKSSVVKTGLLEALDLGIMAQAGSAWRVVLMRPGSTPLANLARGLLEAQAPGAAITDADVDLLRAFLVRGPRSVVEWCRDGHLPPGTNLLLLVDQFEELFRYRDYAGREEAEAFAALLIESARASGFPIYVTLTMRSEYLGACALVEGLAEAISASLFLTPRMGREQCRAAIVGPAAVCGVGIEDALVNRLLNDLAAFAPWDDRSGGDQLDRLVRRADQLPLLQYCLNRMYVRAQNEASGGPVVLRLADYERIGGLAGALNAHADELLRALGAERLPVAESVFRALTEGSTVADAVRRPTRLRELVEISDAQESDVRAVVDTFRAPGCNFLAPELEVGNSKPLDPTAVIDISHESLIRQWKQLSDWLEKEARSVRQWRRLRDRFEDRDPMHGTELANMVAWRDEERPNAAWAKRYGGDLPTVIKFIETSERARRKFAPFMLPLIATATLFIGLILDGGTLSYFYGSTEPSWNWIPAQAVYTLIGAVTCAFGLWLYTGIAWRRSLVAAATIFILNLAASLGFIVLLNAYGLSPVAGSRWWFVTLGTPLTISILGIFDREFWDPFVWFPLAALSSLPFAIIFNPANGIGSDNVRLLLAFVVAILWYVGLGYQFRRGGASDGIDEPGLLTSLTPWPLLGVTVTLVFAIWAFGLGSAAGTGQPPHWLASLCLITAVAAVNCAAGLWRYWRGRPQRAALAGMGVFILLLASGTMMVPAVLSYGSPTLVAIHWWGATLYAPIIVAVLAVFVPVLRPVSVWLPLVALFAAPYALLVWVSDSGTLPLSNDAQGLLVLIVFAVWLAAIGYRLTPVPQRA